MSYDHIVKRYDASDKTIKNVSRYKRLSRLIDDEGYEYIETPESVEIPVSRTDRFYEVDITTRNRLDLVSYNYYGTQLLWWVIALASDIDDPLVVPIGTVLRIPTIDTLYGNGGILL